MSYIDVAGPAVRRVAYAVRTGRLTQEPCVDCGEPKTQAHHPRGYDADHALDVEWVCRRHHLERHRKAVRPGWAVPGRVQAYLAATGRYSGPQAYYSYGPQSSPQHLFKTLRRIWGYLRTDEERAFFLALVDELASPAKEA
jgi:hypothetical protein